MRKKVCFILALSILFSAIGFNDISAEAKEIDIIRISGENRYETSLEIYKHVTKKSKSVIIASGEVFTDALVFGSLSMQNDMPILLVKENEIDNNLLNELNKAEIDKIIIAGGYNTISKNVEDILGQIAPIRRIAGENRYETSVRLKEYIEENNTKLDIKAVASGSEFPDALVATPYIYKNGSILLTDKNHIHEDVDIVFGGENTVKGYEGIKRFGGLNRYETSKLIADEMDFDKVIIADGENFPDALTASIIAKEYNAPIVLTNSNEIPPVIKELLGNKILNKVVIVGGSNSVGQSVEDELNGLLNNEDDDKPTEPEIDKTKLRDKLSEAEKVDKEVYTAESYKGLEEAIDLANKVLSNEKATKEEVDQAEGALQKAIDGLKEKPSEPVVGKTKLKDKLVEAEKVDKEVYTVESYKGLEEAIELSNKVLANEKATKEEVDQAEGALQKAIDGLKEKPTEPVVDKTKLKDKLSEAEKVDKEVYTAESYKGLEEAIDLANKVLSNEKATKEEVDQAESALQEAISNLLRKPDELTSYFKYSNNGDGYKITGLTNEGKEYLKETKKLVFPSEYEGKKITEIDEFAFQGESFTEVILSEFIEKVGFKGFLKNPIQKLVLNEGLKVIDRYAFSQRGLEGGNLESIVLPSTLEEINSGAFDSTNISEVNVPNSLSKLDAYAFDSSKGNEITGKVHVFTPENRNSKNLKDSKYHIIDPAQINITYLSPQGDEISKVSIFGDGASYYHIGEEVNILLESPDNKYSLEKDSLTIIPSEKITNISVKLIDRSTEKVLKSITYPRNVEVDKGTSILDVMELLPKEVKLTDSKENEYTVDVKWSSIGNYDANQPGTYRTYTKIALPEGVKANPDISLDISIDVIVNEETIEKHTISIEFDEGNSNATGLIAIAANGQRFPMVKTNNEYSVDVPNGNYKIVAENLKEGYILVGKQNIEIKDSNSVNILAARKGIILNVKSIDEKGSELRNISYKTIYSMMDYISFEEEETQYELIIPDPEEWDPTKISLDLIEVPEGYKVKTEMPVDIRESYDKEITIEFEKLAGDILDVEMKEQNLQIKPDKDISKGNYIVTDSKGIKVYIGSFSTASKYGLNIDLSNNKPGDYIFKAKVNGINIEKTFKLSK